MDEKKECCHGPFESPIPQSVLTPENAKMLNTTREKELGYLQSQIDNCCCKIRTDFSKPENINVSNVLSPAHYNEGRKYEPRKVIRDWGLNFNLGNVVKYVSRAGRKGSAVEDLKKAKQYIEFELEELEGSK